jgi:hypothetical protein
MSFFKTDNTMNRYVAATYWVVQAAAGSAGTPPQVQTYRHNYACKGSPVRKNLQAAEYSIQQRCKKRGEALGKRGLV